MIYIIFSIMIIFIIIDYITKNVDITEVLPNKYHSNNFMYKNNYTNFLDNKNYVFIVLKSDKKRREHIRSLIKQNNIEKFHIFDAVYGKNINIDKLKNDGYLNDSYVKLPYFKLGALGCTLSHVLILEEFVKSNMERITVFEDDVFFDKDYHNRLANFLANMPPENDISQLLHHPLQMDKIKALQNVSDGNKYIMKGIPQYGTVGYIITKAGARKLLKRIKPIYTAIDDMIMDQIKNDIITSYIPKENIIIMPYKFKSNIWKQDALPAGYVPPKID